MAEVVYRNVEAMVSELADYERRNIFDSAEIKMILKRRTQYEYRLQRRIVKKADFIRYIHFELCVDRLQRSRCKVRRIQGPSNAPDFSILQRIHRLFRSATQKFKGDLKLWLEYIKFCQRSNAAKKLRQVVQDALKFHSYCVGLWVLAGKADFDQDNIDGARLSMLGALRALPTSEKVWIEYFRMELLHVNKLRKRFLASVRTKKGTLSEEHKKVLDSPQFSCHLADKIYGAATRKCDTVSFHLRFLEVYERYSFTESACENVYSQLAERHSTIPEAVNALCARPLRGQAVWSGGVRAEREMECDRLFTAAVERLPVQEMWDFYAAFWLAAVEHHQIARSAAGLSKAVVQYFRVGQRALDGGVLSDHAGLQWIELLLLAGHGTHTVAVLDQMLALRAGNVDCWLKRLQLESTSSDSDFVKLSKKALESVPVDEGEAIRRLCLSWAMANDCQDLLQDFVGDE